MEIVGIAGIVFIGIKIFCIGLIVLSLYLAKRFGIELDGNVKTGAKRWK